jgi:hypothetical protein
VATRVDEEVGLTREEWALWLGALQFVAWTCEDEHLDSGLYAFGMLWHRDLLDFGCAQGWVK